MLPFSLQNLRAFEAAGRNASFRAAAEELHLSISAVSHAVRKLEASLGVTLFERDGRGVRLSAEGEALLRHVSRGFEEIGRGMELVASRGPQLLRLHCAPSFAAQWLTPRLADFMERHPGIAVRLSADVDYPRYPNEEFDAGIVYGPPPQDNVVVIPLGTETVTPLCSPRLAASITRVEDLYDRVLIDSDFKKVRWSDWFAANDLSSIPPRAARFDRSFLAITAAVENLGVALESTRLAAREIASGRLVMPLAGRVRDIDYVGHYLVFPASSRQRAALRVFVAWLGGELGLPLVAL
ncbi:MAG: LysR family transcriptional regulator [Rhizobiales bacterium]|nr:LysR family transcriptional regulator [Hyphomicrobiales bacterium]